VINELPASERKVTGPGITPPSPPASPRSLATSDPRDAETLDEASRNPDGTYNGARAISWLSNVLTGGKGMSEEEVRAIWERETARRRSAP
jgi:hypothetical protein